MQENLEIESYRRPLWLAECTDVLKPVRCVSLTSGRSVEIEAIEEMHIEDAFQKISNEGGITLPSFGSFYILTGKLYVIFCGLMLFSSANLCSKCF